MKCTHCPMGQGFVSRGKDHPQDGPQFVPCPKCSGKKKADPKSTGFAQALAVYFTTGMTPTRRYALNQARKAAADIASDLHLARPQKVFVQVIIKHALERAAAWGKKHPSEL